MKKTICVILGGGQGTRLFPLTKDRAKPAVPIGGKYRLIDVPITNCLRSNINRIFILSQFNSESLNTHISKTYRFDSFHKGFVNILAAEQTTEHNDWFQGTADAVRKSMKHLLTYHNINYVLILSGDQIYKMNYNELFKRHKALDAELTICVKPVVKEECSSFGIMKIKDNFITDFIEKPKDDNLLKDYEAGNTVQECFKNISNDRKYLASMGIYIFNKKTLIQMLDRPNTDFGKEVIPETIKEKKVGAYFYDGYWEDVGSMSTFLKANLDFTSPVPPFNLYHGLLYTHARFLPPSKIVLCTIDQAVVSEGSIIENARIKKSVIGIRSIIKSNVIIENSYVMGADYYEYDDDKKYNRKHKTLDIGIDENTIIKNAIIDKNARIGKNCKIINIDNKTDFDGDNYFIRENIIIIPKHAVIKDNTVI